MQYRGLRTAAMEAACSRGALPESTSCSGIQEYCILSHHDLQRESSVDMND